MMYTLKNVYELYLEKQKDLYVHLWIYRKHMIGWIEITCGMSYEYMVWKEKMLESLRSSLSRM